MTASAKWSLIRIRDFPVTDNPIFQELAPIVGTNGSNRASRNYLQPVSRSSSADEIEGLRKAISGLVAGLDCFFFVNCAIDSPTNSR